MAGSLGTIYAELRLKLDQFKQDIANASTEIKTVQDDVSKSLSAYTEMGNGMKKVGGAMSKYVTAPIVGLGTAAVYTGAQFDSAMSGVMAISGATGSEFEALREQARDLGATTKFTATEAAEGMTMLAMAGLDTNEIMSSIPGMLSLAAAGGLELASAADIVTDTLMAFGDSADQAGRYADVFAKAAASGNTTVEGLGQAMSYGATTAASMGMSVEEASAIMTAFADAGIKSTRAGTTFEAVMRDLRKSAIDGGGALKYTTQAGEEMSVAWYDAEGNARPFLDVLGELEGQLEGATNAERDFAMAQLVQTAGLRGLNILLTRGSENLGSLTDSLYDASGASGEMADIMLDNLAGSLVILKSAVSEVMIGFSDVLAPVIRKVAEWLQKVAQWFGKLSPEMKKVITVVLAVVAAIGPLLVIFGTILTMIPMMVKGWAILKGAMMVVMLPAIKIVAIIAAIIAVGVLLYKNWDKIKEFAGTLWEGIKSGWTAMVEGIKNLFIGIGEFFVGVWDSITTTFTNAFTAIVEWFTSLPERIATGLESFVTAVSTGIQNVVTFFSELPGKVLTFLQKLFFEDIPYWVGYGLGTMVRLVIEGIENTVTFFSELPGKILEFLTELWENISNKWTETKETMTRLATEAIEAVVTFFSELPGKVLNWLQTTWTNIQTKFTEMKQTMITKTTEAINSVVTFFRELPGKVWTWLVNTVNKIIAFGTDALAKAKDAGQQVVDGFISIVTGLPGLIWDTLMSVGSKLTEAGSELWNKAKSAAGRLWEGFKKGLGIQSPSYLEEAMFDIVDTGKWMLDSMKSDFRTLGNVKVNPPSLSNMGSTLKQGMNEVSRLMGGDQQFAFAGAVTGPTEQVVRHEHAGVLEIRGTDDEGQFVDAVRVVMDELRREVRT
jgi:TP901 family phage tail tape measure protein